MDYLIDKRDGRRQKFNRTKIINAMTKACEAERGEVDEEFSAFMNKVADGIEELVKASWEVKDHKVLSVENIQDIIENKLMASKHKDVAKKYILYRNKRTRSREYNADFMREVTRKIEAIDVDNQNANVDEHSFGGRKGEAEGVLMKKYALDYLLSDIARKKHLDNEIYEHDLDHFPLGDHNCLSIPFDDLLANGFKVKQTDMRPPRSIGSAMQLTAVIFQLQSLDQFGGCSATHIDWTMIPYVRLSFYKHYKDGLNYIERLTPQQIDNELKSDKIPEDISIDDKNYYYYERAYDYAMTMTKREAKQAVEAMYHNLNSLQSRSGNQLPFTSINYGTCTKTEGRLVTRTLLEVSIEGLGKYHRTSIFPCGIFQCMRGVNRKKGDPNYDLFKLALESTAKRLYPNYCNVDWSGNAGYDPNDPRTYMSTMGCRTYNGFDINGFGQLKDGRGNICPVTIILPTLAMQAKEKAEKTGESIIDCFMQILNDNITTGFLMLRERYDYICSQSPKSAPFMYGNNTMAGFDGENIESALKHGTLALGQLGLAETLQILVGCNQTVKEGFDLACKIEQLFKDRCKEQKEKEHLNYGVYYTPAENLCYTAMQKFKKKYGEIPNVSDKEFFTNSVHVPVWEEIDPFKKIDIESVLDNYSNAGCILYVELESSVKNNIDAVETLVNYAMDKDVPYFAINVPNDQCEDCGYSGDMDDECPMCHGYNVTHLRRVTGYLTSDYKTAFNLGKQQEVELRYKHSQKLRGWNR